MKKNNGFVSIVILSIVLALSTATVWWWHSVDLTSRLVYEKKRYYETRYCAEFCLYQCAHYVSQQMHHYLTQAQKEPILQSGLISWQRAGKKQVVVFLGHVQLVNDGLLLSVTVNNNGSQATMKGFLHAVTNETQDASIKLDHLTLCAHL